MLPAVNTTRTREALVQLGYDPGSIAYDDMSGLGYYSIAKNADGSMARQPSGHAVVTLTPWPSKAVWHNVRAALDADGYFIPNHLRKYVPGQRPEHKPDAEYPIDAVILLRRLNVTEPTSTTHSDLMRAESMLTPEQFDEYETRYARMYGEDD